jgi:hypothetical protein
VQVIDALIPKYSTKITDQESFEAWQEGLQRVFAWRDPPKEDWDITEGSDIQMINKKNSEGAKKHSTADIPPVAILALGAAMRNGADKYGSFNWRDSEVTTSVFYNALQRHLLQWWSGEDFADDSKVHHLAHIMAGCAILLDAESCNVLNDDRSKCEMKERFVLKLHN